MSGSRRLKEQLLSELTQPSTEEPPTEEASGSVPSLVQQWLPNGVYAGTVLPEAAQAAPVAPAAAWNPFSILQALSSTPRALSAWAQLQSAYLPQPPAGVAPHPVAAGGPLPLAGPAPMAEAPSQQQQPGMQSVQAPLLVGATPAAAPAGLLGMDALQSPRKKNKKRARILRDGQLTIIVYGANEALLWSRRIATFQQAMRGVLGERRHTFTWSGSVTDSVVGVFLTQNVADTLSSRAYMEVASRWPVKRLGQGGDGGDGGSGGAASGGLHDVADSVDWEAVRLAPHAELADAIKCRGMQLNLATRIKAFLNHTRETNLRRRREAREVAAVTEDMVAAVAAAAAAEAAAGSEPLGTRGRRARSPITLEYEASAEGSLREAGRDLSKEEEEEEPSAQELLSLEWLRSIPDEEARQYLLRIDGLGRKSVACIMLLSLGKKEFPVDTNVGRISARLGWIPLDAEQAVEDMDDYAPEPEVHSYLHSRLMGFPLETLYEAHYQMITLGKVFCSKAAPNCRACPMRGECEYALNNGPSLHGRKRQRAAAAAASPVAAQGSSLDPGLAEAPPLGAADLAPPGPVLSKSAAKKAAPPAAWGGSAPPPPMHWRTVAKLQRLQQKRRDFEARFSVLRLEALIRATPRAARSQRLRRPLPATELGRLVFTAEDAAAARAGQARRPLTAAEGPSVWCQAAGGAAAAWPEIPSAGPDRRAAGVPPQDRRGQTIWALSAEAAAAQTAPAARRPAAQQPAAAASGGPVVPAIILSQPVAAEAASPVAASPTAQVEAECLCLTPETPDAQDVVVDLTHLEDSAEAAEDGSAGVSVPQPELELELEQQAQQQQEAQQQQPEEVLLGEADLLAGIALPAEGEELAAAPPMLLQAVPLPDPLQAWAAGSPEAECERLVALGQEMGRVQQAIAVSEGKSSTACLKDRMVELGLAAMGVETAVTAESAQTVLAQARRHYRQLSMAVHPDKCKHPGAEAAFAALGQGMQAILQHAGPGANAGAGLAAAAVALSPTDLGDGGAQQLGPLLGGEAMLERLVWTQNRMVLQAYLIPPELHPQLKLLHSLPASSSTAQEPLLFLPLTAIPAYEEHSGRSIAGRPAGGGGGAASGPIHAEVAEAMQAILEVVAAGQAGEPAAAPSAAAGPEAQQAAGAPPPAAAPSNAPKGPPAATEEGGPPQLTEGVLFVSCRAALKGRFPLNGTYFQVNECFADCVTVDSPIEVPASLLEGCRVSPIHFGLGMHYMAKGMTQPEVAHMFAEGFVCFRAYHPATGAPAVLPRWLVPSVPNTKPTIWKNKDERAAARLEKLQKLAALSPPQPQQQPPLPAQLEPRLIRVPMVGEDVQPPAPVLADGQPRPQLALERPWQPSPPPKPVKRKASVAEGGPAAPSTPEKAAKKNKKQRLLDAQSPQQQPAEGAEGLSAADRKSGKGRTRVQLVPKVKASQRCGHCPECLNPHWRKACSTLRNAAHLGAGAAVAHPVGPE